MKKTKKLAALLLVFALALSLLPTTAFASFRTGKALADRVLFPENGGLIPTPSFFRSTLRDASTHRSCVSTSETRAAADELPSRYNSSDYGYITPVRNQNGYNTCWTFGTMGPVEAYMVKHGVKNPKTGVAYTASNLDLSEYHLGWFSYTNAYDKLGMLTGDASAPNPDDATFISSGGNGLIATMTLMRWEGLASEEEPALAYSRISPNGIDPKYAYNYNVAHVESVDWIPASQIDDVKRAILEYGAGSISIYADGAYLNSSTLGFCCKQTAAPGTADYKDPTHVVTVVGWDDHFPVSSFNTIGGPTHDGAWIIKNSWGSDYPTMYVSYEDSACCNELAFFFQVGNVDNYDNNYQYDGTSSFYDGQNCAYAENGGSFANVFTANGEETLRAVSINNLNANVHYQLDIYKNLTSATDPSSGVKVSSQTGTIVHYGYHTVPLEVPVCLGAGDTFSVVFTLTHDTDEMMLVGGDMTTSCPYAKWTHVRHEDTTFVKSPGWGGWDTDSDDFPFSLRIKAYTDDTPGCSEPEGFVTALSNNESLGTVYVTGSTVIANPAEGCYLDHCELVSGTATWTMDGDAIHVNASDDCVLRVCFDEIPQAEQVSVVCVICGLNYGNEIFPQGSRIYLPASVDYVPEGWEFCGWTDQPLASTTEEPDYYAPGTPYILNADTVFYALYTRSDGYGELAFQLLTAAPETWEGNYVITSSTDASMHVLKGASASSVTGMSTAAYAPTLSASGITLNQDTMTNVSSIYQFHIFPSGNSYRVQNVATEAYLGGTTTLYAITQSYTNYLPWVLSFQNGAVQMKNTYKGNDLSYNKSGYFHLNKTASTVYLWKEAPLGVTWFSTDFIADVHEHALQFYPAVAPTCVEGGNIACYYCPICGGCFLDSDAENEIPMDEALLPALGHVAGESVVLHETAPTCGADGSIETVTYCVRCNAELSLDQTVIPATNDHSFGGWEFSGAATHQRICTVCGTAERIACTYTEEIIPPTVTDMGYTLHTCTVCGHTFTDCFVAPIGSDYVITFSVPNSVTPVASMTCTPGSSITLPTADAPDGYTFLGWVPATVSATQAMPSGLLTGTYQPSGNNTLYALYSYTEGSSEVGFQLLTAAPETWEGNYVITYTANANSMRVLKGAVSSSVVGISYSAYAPALASTGMTLNQNMLTNVNPLYQFTVTAHGSSYWIQNASTGSYIGGTTVLYAVTQRYSSYLNWTFSFRNGAPLLCNTHKGNYLNFNTGNGGYFCETSGTNTNIRLWKQVPVGTTYYTTTIQ
ncbi:MAG: InlB B-repeat-containing protein [Oscillospiraceae bacterium]|nr:InlB B-repeat-containing protein [Oscillospiraceae bacterium]